MNGRLERVRPLLRTRQCRHFTDEPVDEADLRALTEVARWTGSSRNSQPWLFLVTRDVDLIRALGELGHPQTRALHLASAAIAIVMPQDETRTATYAYDEGRVAERILVAAGMLGLGAGICWVRSDVRQRAAELLALPADRFVRTVMAVGLASAEGAAPKSASGQARLPHDELVLTK